MRTLLFFMVICLFTTSCTTDLATGNLLIDNCGSNEKVGEFELLESSLSYFSYNQNDIEILFEDHDGVQHLFTQNKFETTDDEFEIFKMLCHESLADESWEYFNHQSNKVTYKSQNGDEIKIHLYTSFEGGDNINQAAVFDRLNLSTDIGFLGSWTQTGIVTGYHQNGPLNENSSFVSGNAKIVSDTLIGNYQYQNVYESRSFKGRSIFYTKKDGVFLISNPDGKFLRLKK